MNKNNGAICGGVVKESEFMKDPMEYMMSYIMPDDKFDEYVKLKDINDDKKAGELFNQHAWSAI